MYYIHIFFQQPHQSPAKIVSPLIGGFVLSNIVRLVGVVCPSIVNNPTTTSWSPSPIREGKSTTGLSPLIGDRMESTIYREGVSWSDEGVSPLIGGVPRWNRGEGVQKKSTTNSGHGFFMYIVYFYSISSFSR